MLFDLGGVLIDFGGVDPMKELAGITSDNVDGAVAAGFHAVRVAGVDEARDALVDAGILSSVG